MPSPSGRLSNLLSRRPGWAFFVTLAWLPVLNSSPWGDLSHWYKDHLHHAFATWVALQKGLAIYTRPFQEIWAGTGWPYPVSDWGYMPGFAYPPGVAVVFLPLTLIGRTGLLSMRSFGVLGVLSMLAIAAAAFHATVSALKALPEGSRYAVGVLAWLILSQMGLQGFYDSAYVACGAMMVVSLRRNEPEKALLWFAAALMLHFRAAVLAPLGAYALYQVLRGRKLTGLPRRTLYALGAVALSGLICVGSFLLMYPTTAQFRAQAVQVLSNANAQAIVVAMSLVTGALLLASRESLAAATLAVVVALAEVEVQNFWWHGAMVLFVPLTIGLRAGSDERERPFSLPLLRAAALLWCFAIHPVVWRDHPGEVFTEFVKFFKV